MRRFVDELGEPYSFYHLAEPYSDSTSGLTGGHVAVKCPECSQLAHITLKEGRREVRCTKCFFHKVEQPVYRFTASGICQSCERWFNVELGEKLQMPHKNIRLSCPHCGKANQVPVNQKPAARYTVYRDIRRSSDPVFGLELYYLDYFRGKPVWAVNRKHLNYLIAYLSASIRQKPTGVYKRAASYRLPQYMKDAKNRSAVVKLLRKMQLKAD
ncbi:hypothetical protein GCM10010912_63960 [Paenibacillus albidus]|uniref:Uncharacterized protein n=1 Tax=Paenibacillus albidus TaxID=2041023 RepID=A0A917D5U4_9BACL|nr:hypothetical protein [Paenibacillus albidus]GGG10771.1 hypothetical protein GCM10010912_63960 [Paenibacillus albidus]